MELIYATGGDKFVRLWTVGPSFETLDADPRLLRSNINCYLIFKLLICNVGGLHTQINWFSTIHLCRARAVWVSASLANFRQRSHLEMLENRLQ
jgi:hypothetical protein